jgi:hypothetical protein
MKKFAWVALVSAWHHAGGNCFNFAPADEQDLIPHLVCTPDATTKPTKLVVFFPGTNGKPTGQLTFGNFSSSSAGMHTIVLAYPDASATNPDTVGGLCYNRTDGCFGKLRLVKQYGGSIGGLVKHQTVTVSKREAADTRLRTVLDALAKQHPSAGWGSFIDGAPAGASTRPAWGKVVAAGHSQGAGQALLVGKNFSVDRVLMFAGVDDVVFPGATGEVVAVPAPWVADAGKTPASKLWGLGNVNGFCCGAWNANWPSLGVPGAEAGVDAPAVPPYGGSQYLCGDAGVPPKQAHGAVVQRADLYAGAWAYMLGASAGGSGSGSGNGSGRHSKDSPCACPTTPTSTPTPTPRSPPRGD